MSNNSEVFSNDIRWQLLAVSRDMMDTTQGNTNFPFAWRSSLAVYAAVPPTEEQIACEQQTLYLKIGATITGYQPSKEETEQGYVQFPDVPIEEMDRIIKEYFACYGAFLQVAVFPRQPDTPLASYPHIVDFEPKVRDLYQAATEHGEILTASKSGVKTDRSFSHTDKTETGLDLSATLKFPLGKKDSGKDSGKESVKGSEGTVGGKLSHEWGETVNDTWQVIADAARERRETTGMKTEISQMYNLLTGYHAGTNRAVFLMLPRPHILQPTDHRTFVQGLRVIEGIQEFFLIIQHPTEMQGLCVDVSLDTGHFPEHVDIEEPEEVYEETSEEFWVEAYADNGFFSGDRESFERLVMAPAGWVVDRRKGDPGHAGCSELEDKSNQQARDTLREYLYGAINDSSVSVSGSVKGAAAYGDGAIFRRKYRAYFRSERPIPSSEESFVASPFLITNRRLGVCLVKQDNCFLEMPPDVGYWHDDGDWVVNEMSLEIPGNLIRKSAQKESRTPLLKAALKEIETGLVRSGRLRTRYPYGTINYLASDYFLQKIAPYLPKDYVNTAIGDLSDIPASVRDALGEQTTIGQVLSMDCVTLSGKMGASLEEAIALKQRMARRNA
jgi:hypothetical protein